jgi:hypothetical protein
MFAESVVQRPPTADDNASTGGATGAKYAIRFIAEISIEAPRTPRSRFIGC